MRVLRSWLFTVVITAGILLCILCTPIASASAYVAVPQGQGSSLHGFVIVGRGTPIPNANVTVEGTAGAQAATTNAAGEYTISGLGAGVCHIRISASGFDPYEATVSLTAGTKREVDAVLFPTPAPPEPAPNVAVPEAAPVATPEQNPAQGNEAPTAPQQAAPVQQTVAAQGFSVKAEKGKAALYGIATDQSGAVIQGASATATGPGGPVTVNANTLGQYVFNRLAPGQYKLSVSAPGFAPFETDVTVAADQALQLDAPLQPKGNVTEVNVQGAGATEIQTESAHIEGTITQKEVLQTGLNGRNFTQLIALAPGVSNQTGQDEALVGVKGSVKYSVNGGRVEYNNFDVDGSDVLNAGLNGAESTLMVYPSLDGIQEVKVLTSNYGAQYGRSASGTVLVTTRSGTHDFHGVAYDFIRNEFFNARNYFDETPKAPLYRRQDFGGAIGGPLTIPGVFNTKRDKTFFFWSEEFRLEKTPQEFNQAVPTLSERTFVTTSQVGATNCPALSGGADGTCANFQDVCPPQGTALDRSQFPDCPAAAGGSPEFFVPVSPTSQAILNTGMIPLPNSATGCNSSLAGTVNVQTNQPNIPCYVAVISPSTYWREELGRFDQSITQNLHLMARYIHDSWDTTQATPLWGYVQNSFPTVQERLNGPGTSMVVRLTDTISPKLLNDFVVSYVNAHITLREQNGPGASVVNNAIQNCADNGGASGCMSYIFQNNAGGKPPGIVIGGTNAQYGGNGFTVDPSYAPWDHTNPTYSLGDDVGLSLGHHTLHFGVQIVDAQRSETNGAIGAATGDLQGLLTFSNQNSITNGNAFADFLLTGSEQTNDTSHIKSYQQDSAQLKYYNNYWITEPYAQDDWRVTPRLTVNVGLRLSLFGNYHEKNNNAWNWIASKFTPVSGVTIAEVGANQAPGGYLAEKDGITPIPFSPNNLSFSSLPSAITNGLVHCGTGGVPSSCMSTHYLNPAPRIGFAWDPKGDGKTSIRGGYGVFFEHGTPKEANTGSLEGNSPLVLTMTDPFPFPGYNGIGLGGANNTTPLAFPPDVTSIPTKAVWPYVQQWSFSVQRQLPKDMVTSIAYVGSKGTHLNAELQINQLTPPPTGPDTGILPAGNPYLPGQPILTTLGQCTFNFGPNPNSLVGSSFGSNGTTTIFYGQPAFTNMLAACFGTDVGSPNGSPSPGILRPYFGFGRILSLQNIADSQYHALQFTLRRTRGPLTMGVSYTYSHSLDDSSDRSDSTFVNSANIKSSWASSSFDQRHLFNFNYVYDLPKLASTFRRWTSYRSADDGGDSQSAQGPKRDGGLLHALLDGWQLSGITTFQSGTPFSVINGGSNNLGISVLDNAGIANGAGAGSFPDVLASPRSALPNGVRRFNTQSIGPLLYNPAAFEAPQGLTFGNAGRNFLNNPHRLNFDMSGFKNFKITEGSTLELRAEAFNVFNHTQFRIFNPNLGNSAQNTISCYGGGLDGAPFTAIGGPTPAALTTGIANQPPGNVDCTTGGSFLRPVDAHRPRTIQLGLKYSF